MSHQISIRIDSAGKLAFLLEEFFFELFLSHLIPRLSLTVLDCSLVKLIFSFLFSMVDIGGGFECYVDGFAQRSFSITVNNGKNATAEQ